MMEQQRVVALGPWFEQWSHLHYLAALTFCVVVTVPLELWLGARVYRRPRQLAVTLFVAATPFLAWDLMAIEAGHWWFSDDHTIGASIGPMPLEEVLFFVVIPLAALLTYEAVSRVRGAASGPPAADEGP